jgi:hypothetical protein
MAACLPYYPALQVLLVGGFARSPYLEGCVKEAVQAIQGDSLQVVVPLNPHIAVLSGECQVQPAHGSLVLPGMHRETLCTSMLLYVSFYTCIASDHPRCFHPVHTCCLA